MARSDASITDISSRGRNSEAIPMAEPDVLWKAPLAMVWLRGGVSIGDIVTSTAGLVKQGGGEGG